jgi:DNA-binding transcriptional LysR family regulator
MAAEHEQMLAALRSDESADRVRIGLIDSIAHLLYGSEDGRSLLQEAEVLVDNSRRILRDISKKRIDCGIVTGQPTPISGELTVSKLHEEKFVFVAAPGRASHQTPNRVDDWLATNPDSTTYRYFTDYFQRAHMHVTPIFHSASMELLRDMAVNGKGTALLPHHFVQSALNHGELIMLSPKPVMRPIWAVSRSPQTVDPAQPFAACINALLV